MKSAGQFVEIWKASIGYMLFTSIVGIVLGLVLLFYPGGATALMQAAFMIFQVVLSIFIIAYMISEAACHIRAGRKAVGVLYIIIGVLAAVLIWVFNVTVIFYLIALFLILVGVGEVIGGFKMTAARYFLIFLGIVNVLVGVVILRYPLALPILIGWYLLFRGISRFFLALELRKMRPS